MEELEENSHELCAGQNGNQFDVLRRIKKKVVESDVPAFIPVDTGALGSSGLRQSQIEYYLNSNHLRYNLRLINC